MSENGQSPREQSSKQSPRTSSELIARFIKALRKTDLVELGVTGKFKVKDVQSKLIDQLRDLNLNEILIEGISHIDTVDSGEPVVRKPRVSRAIDSISFNEEHPNSVAVTNYKDYEFNNLFFDPDETALYELRKNKYYLKPLTTRKECGAIIKDSKGNKRFIKIDKL
jgi:hypothetical protein